MNSWYYYISITGIQAVMSWYLAHQTHCCKPVSDMMYEIHKLHFAILHYGDQSNVAVHDGWSVFHEIIKWNIANFKFSN